MKGYFTLFAILVSMALSGQYQFSGQVSDSYNNSYVYLSLVEDYRKTSRVYIDQVIQTTRADAKGFFAFEGSALPQKNRIYRIHVDGCEEGITAKNHFLRECSSTESLLFIANNSDTLSIPLQSEQAFCEISSTNSSSAFLLEMDALKEEMIVDFMDGTTKTAQSLKFEKWFKKFQEFALNSEDPLVQLCVFDFLSDRKNETYEYFLDDVQENEFYSIILDNLSTLDPAAPFTLEYSKEYASLKPSVSIESSSTPFNFENTKYLLLLLVGIPIILLVWKKQKRSLAKFPKEQLTNQESKIFHLIKLGKTNKEIAAELFISHSTVKTHVNNIYKKLGISSRDELQSKF